MAIAPFCPACGGTPCRPALEYPRLPAFLFPMPREQAAQVERHPLRLSACTCCGHLFQAQPAEGLQKRIYEEYYVNYPFGASPEFAAVHRHPFDQLAEQVLSSACEGKLLLEIGCSAAANLKGFRQRGYQCVGIDPSPLAAESQSEVGIRIISGYYETTILPVRADVIVSRFVLEHVIDLAAHVAKIACDLQPGGRLLAQVPNTDFYIANHQPFFAAHEHVHYFSVPSLTALLARYGFSPEAIEGSEKPSLVACFRKVSSSPVNWQPPPAGTCLSRLDRYKQTVAENQHAILQMLPKSTPLVLYGCGLNCWWLLQFLPETELTRCTLVDDNPSLEGKYLPAFLLPVRKPAVQAFTPPAWVLLLLNPLYQPKVLEKLGQFGLALRGLRLSVTGLEKFELSAGTSMSS